MANQQKRQKAECQASKCLDINRCQSHFGRQCKRIDGSKIPRLVITAVVQNMHPPNDISTTFKPFLIEDGWPK